MDLSRHFIAVDTDARVGDVVDLAAGLTPGRIVIRDMPAFAARPDDDNEEDRYFVLDAGDLAGYAADPDTTIGKVLLDISPSPASVLDESAVWGMGHAAHGPTVVLDEGLVTGVFAEPPPSDAPRRRSLRGDAPPRDGGGGGEGDGDGEAGSAMAVAVDYPESVVVGETMSLLISLTAETAASDAIPIVAAVGDVIDVVVSPKSGFVVEGSAEGRLEVTGEAEPLPIQIRLRAKDLGRGRVIVYAFRAGVALGSLAIGPEVVAAGTPTGPTTSASRDLRLDQRAPEADLELQIFEQQGEAGMELRFRLSSPDPSLGLNLKPFGPVPISEGAGPYFTQLYTEIEKLPLKTDEDKAIATERLHSLGASLFQELLPADLQALLWDLQDRIESVLVQSDEPWVPWELCRLHGERDGRVEEGPFFCEAFEFTRWIPGFARFPELRLSKLGLIVPGDSQLESAQAEAKMVRALKAAGREVVDVKAEYLAVKQALAEGTLTAIHFTGHGEFPDQSNPTKAEIQLEGGQKLRPNDISGAVKNLGLGKPLVFLNACQVGRQSRALTGVGGWATALLRAGAGAFVGAHWEVGDDLAFTFAETFYGRLVAGDPVATAARAARLAIRDTGDPTWLAYTVFAEPGAKLAA